LRAERAKKIFLTPTLLAQCGGQKIESDTYIFGRIMSFRYIIDINAISSSETMLCEVAITTDHQPVSFSYSNHEKLGIAIRDTENILKCRSWFRRIYDVGTDLKIVSRYSP
jgi:hypothetical protein